MVIESSVKLDFIAWKGQAVAFKDNLSKDSVRANRSYAVVSEDSRRSVLGTLVSLCVGVRLFPLCLPQQGQTPSAKALPGGKQVSPCNVTVFKIDFKQFF